jgi:hypothetical protein
MSLQESSVNIVNNLPDDVLRYLFWWVVATSENYPPLQYILLGVCRRWRELVLHCPLLWSTIHAPIGGPYDPLVFFERSAPAPLSVTLYSTWAHDFEMHTQISNAILQHLSRLTRLTIDVVRFDEIAPFLEAWRDRRAPNFRHFELSCSEDPEKDTTIDLNHEESLRSVKLRGLSFKFLPVLRYLTVLELSRLRPDPRMFHDLFAQFPALETLIVGVLSAPSESTDSTWPIQEILAPSLKTLAINLANDHTENCLCPLPHLTADNLEHLEISHFGSIFADDYVSLNSHFKTSPRLRKMRIRGHLFMEQDTTFLASLPNGACLEIIGFPSHRDPGAGLPILNLENLGSITIDLTPTLSKYTSDFDIVAFHGVLQNTRDLAFKRPVAVCCASDESALAAWKSTLGNRFSIRPTSLPTGYLDDYLIPCDESLDGLSDSSQNDYYDWDGDVGGYQDYGDYEYDEEDDYPDESGIGSDGEDEIYL